MDETKDGRDEADSSVAGAGENGAAGAGLPKPGDRKAEAPRPAGAAPLTLAGALGEIVWLLSQSPLHRHLFLADLEWAIIPPLLLSQFRSFRDGDRMIGVALWATVSAEVEARLESGVGKLRPGEWNGGDRLWLLDLVAPWGGQDAMLADLRASVFKGKKVRMSGQKDYL